MALSRSKKQEEVAELQSLLSGSRLTVVARYSGTSVKNLQQLRDISRESDTHIRVAKNRLFKKALEANDRLKTVDTSDLSGQLMYAFNASDEVAPAQNLANFAKDQPQMQFIGAITFDGQWLSAPEVQMLAALLPKDQLRAQLISTIAAPINNFVSVISANMRDVLNVFAARAKQINE